MWSRRPAENGPLPRRAWTANATSSRPTGKLRVTNCQRRPGATPSPAGGFEEPLDGAPPEQRLRHGMARGPGFQRQEQRRGFGVQSRRRAQCTDFACRGFGMILENAGVMDRPRRRQDPRKPVLGAAADAKQTPGTRCQSKFIFWCNRVDARRWRAACPLRRAGKPAGRDSQDTRAPAKPEAFATIRPVFPRTPIAFLSSNVSALHRQRFSSDFIYRTLNTFSFGLFH